MAVISRAQALAAGRTPAAVRWQLSSGRWRVVHPGVYATCTGALERPDVLRAALLYAGPGAVLSRETAAEVLGLTETVEATVHVTVPVDRRVRARPGIRVHYAHQLVRSRTTRGSLPVTRVEDTVLDLVDDAQQPRSVIDWITRACQRRLTTPDRLRAALRGRKKIRRRELAEGVLADVSDGAETPLELAYLERVERRHGLPDGVRQRHRQVGPGSQWIDVEYRAERVRVELDGRIGHVDDGVFRDRDRDNSSAAEGFATLRYGWTDTVHDSCPTAYQVATVLRRAGWRGEGRACGQACVFRPR